MHGGRHSHILTHTYDLGPRTKPSMSALSPRSGIQVSSVYPTYTYIKGQCPLCVCVFVCVCIHVCVYACMCVCVAKPVTVKLRCHVTALIQTSVKPLDKSKPNLCGTSLGRGNKSLFMASGSHDQDGRHAHIL